MIEMPRWPGALVVIALALAVSACGGGEEEYSREVERNFTEQCIDQAIDTGGGALLEADANEYCSCAYERVEATVPFEEFAEYDEQAREDANTPLPPKFEAAITTCRAKQGYSKSTEKTFVAACAESAVEEGLTEAQAQEYCGCAFAEIEEKVPFEEFAEYDAKALKNPSAQPPPKMAAAVERCANALG